MDNGSGNSQTERGYWVGIDWSESSHAVNVVDDGRRQIVAFFVENSLEGYEQLDEQLRGLGLIRGIAIEATINPIFNFLIEQGYILYSINPKVSKKWRECNSVEGGKSDPRDGRVLSEELARRHESLRTYKQADPEAAQLAGLCESVSGLVAQRTALIQQLKAALRTYYPAALEFFDDFTSPAAWRFVKRFPRPEVLARARKGTVIGFLKKNRIGLSPVWLERIERLKHGAVWPQSPRSAGYEQRALAAVAQLISLQRCIEYCESTIANYSRARSEFSLLDSLPGAGKRLAPALTAIIAQLEAEADLLQALRCLSGVAPVQNQSGKVDRCQVRKRCNKHWRHTLHNFAMCSTQHCKWARAYYTLCKERGDGHATALRKLADKWLKIIHRMLENNAPYDDARYVAALNKSGSPVYAKMCG